MLITPYNLVRLFFAGMLYFLLAKLGMVFALKPSNITLLWLPAGVGFVMCLWRGNTALPYIFFASFFANFSGMAKGAAFVHILHTAVSAGADTLAAWLAWKMFVRFLPEGLTSIRHLFAFLFFVCILPTLASAVIIATNLALGGYIAWPELLAFIAMLILADSLGILFVFHLYDDLQNNVYFRKEELTIWLGLTSLSIALIVLSFFWKPGLIFFSLPIIVYLVFHVNTLAVHVTLAAKIITIIILASKINYGPFDIGVVEQSRFLLQSFLLSMSLLVISAMLQRKELIVTIQSRQAWKDSANHDHLTGLLNRRAFIPMIEDAVDRAKSGNGCFSFAALDIDYFKQVNDRYGHSAGDKVLQTVAECIASNVGDSGKAARMGGDEFAILFQETWLENAHQIMEKIRREVERLKIQTDKGEIPVTISIGLCVWYNDRFDDVDDMLHWVDGCLYNAKNSGRNHINLKVA